MNNKIFFTPNYIEVTCDRNSTETQHKLASIYPIHANRIGTNFKISARFIPTILFLLRGITDENVHTAPIGVQEYYYREKAISYNFTDLLQNGPRHSPTVNSRLTLMKHQQLGREIAQYKDRFAYFYDTRTGKTPLALSIIYDDIKKNPKHKWLVICPLILIEDAWLSNAEDFFPNMSVVNCHASTKKKRLEKMQLQGNVYVTNTESFVNYLPHFEKMGFTGCFVDESSDMKSHRTKISKAIVGFAQRMKRFYLLSGTPAPNGEYEYYMQLKAIDFYGIQRSWTQFKERYFINVSWTQYEKLALRPDRRDELIELVKCYSLFVDKEDVLTTPGRSFNEVELDMPDSLKKHYNLIKYKLYTELGDKLILVPSTAAKLNKLNQITSGFIIDTKTVKNNKLFNQNEVEWHMISEYRFKALQELLDKIGDEQVLIWANYRAEFGMLESMFKDSCRSIHGGISHEDKVEAIKLFKSGKVQYLLANPASANKGLTLTNTHIAVYFSLNWSYELFKQSMERIYADISRQPKHCQYYIFMAKGTIDQILYRDVLRGKEMMSYAILKHLKSKN